MNEPQTQTVQTPVGYAVIKCLDPFEDKRSADAITGIDLSPFGAKITRITRVSELGLGIQIVLELSFDDTVEFWNIEVERLLNRLPNVEQARVLTPLKIIKLNH